LNGTFFFIVSEGASIAGGSASSGNATVENSTIGNRNFRILSSDGAGIGAGNSDGGIGSVMNVLMNRGVFRISTTRGAGIGSGFALIGSAQLSTLLIEDGNSMIFSLPESRPAKYIKNDWPPLEVTPTLRTRSSTGLLALSQVTEVAKTFRELADALQIWQSSFVCSYKVILSRLRVCFHDISVFVPHL
jgi:hypothetical protein